MEKFQVWVDLSDRRYAKRLMEFLTVRYGESMQIVPMGKKGVMPDGQGVLLTDRVMEEETAPYGQVVKISAEEGINPYQSGHQIAREILEGREKKERQPLAAANRDQQGEWISVYSPIGGIGKSTLAMGLAEVLAKRNEVLFLELEGASAWELYYRYSQAYTLSDYLYCFLIEREEQKRKRLEEMVERQENGVYFLPPCLYPDDLLELTEEEILSWMSLLKERFDYVVADLSSQLLRPLRIILANSSRPCYLVDWRPEGQAKWADFRVKNRLEQKQQIFYRFGDKEKQGEICLPEEQQLYEMPEGRRRLREDSAYYRCLERAVEAWK